jgi:hypothetical protein
MTLPKGRVDVAWKDEKTGNLTDVPWYDTIDYEKMRTPPHLGRNAKGWRFDFSSYENLHQKAMEIKERYPYYFKNENDVYKDDHYIGMYILERVLSHNNKFKKFDYILAMSCDIDSDIVFKEFLRDRFLKSFENYAKGIISEDDLLGIRETIISALPDDHKKWFEEECERIMSGEYEANKISEKLRKQKYRGKVAEAYGRGLKVM